MVKNLKSSSISQSVKSFLSDKGLVNSFMSVFFGINSGAIFCSMNHSDFKEELLSFFLTFYTDFTDKTKAEIFSGIVFSGLTYFIIMLIFGSSFLGKEISLLTTFIKAVGIGAMISFFYSQYELKGLEYVLLVFFPGKVVLIIGMLFLTKCCYDTSDAIRKSLKNQEGIGSVIQIYLAKSGIVLAVFLLSWTIDFLFIIIFSKLFNF